MVLRISVTTSKRSFAQGLSILALIALKYMVLPQSLKGEIALIGLCAFMGFITILASFFDYGGPKDETKN